VKKIAVLGSTGMIGSGVTRGLTEYGFDVTEFNRSGESTVSGNAAKKFDIQNVTDESLKDLSKFAYVVNSTGMIRHKISSDSQEDIENAIKVNCLFPQRLGRLAKRHEYRVIQIGTDCVFSGTKGGYRESESFNPIDSYGFSKALGESCITGTMTLRVSVIGQERNSSTELMNWVTDQNPKAELRGFTNHLWNGVTPLQLSKILSFLIKESIFFEGIQHLVPQDKVSKYQLIKTIAETFGRSDLAITEFQTDTRVDRSLDTQNVARNLQLWEGAGYNLPPTIEDMIKEYKNWISPKSDSKRA
jgi:dTDP-4-dehydrorhamnose reductase